MAGPTVGTIKRLFAVSGNRCAFPGCDLPLVDEASGNVLGEICHVKARSPDGPRYDREQKEEERHGFGNLVLLCPTHHAIVDGDAGTYTVEELLRIKAEHEGKHVGGAEPSDEVACQFLLQLGIWVGQDLVVGDKLTGDKVGVKIVQQDEAEVAASLHQLRPPPGDFTGREKELVKLRRAIEGGGVTISGVRGMGGIGKTALALRLAAEVADGYPDAQIYLDLKGTDPAPVTVAEAMAHVVRAYHPTARLPEGEAELQAAYHTVLHGQRALLLMDNAAGRAQVEPLIPPSSCVLLVTSRQHFTLPGMRALNLGTLPPKDARELLLRVAERVGDCADEMARLCGYLPLALRLAGSALAEREDLRLADYLHWLADEQARLGLVEASLSLSYELLGRELQRRWAMLAVFPGTFDRGGAAAVWGVEPDEGQDALSDVVRYSLVEWDGEAERYHLHDLARLFAGAWLEEGDRAAGQRRHAAYYQGVARAANELYGQGRESVLVGLGLFDLEWGNIEAGHAWAVQNAEKDGRGLELCDEYPAGCFRVLPMRQHPRERIAWLEAALEAAKELDRKQAQSWHLGNLGNAYRDLGEVGRAIAYYEQALTIAREIGHRRGEGNHVGNLGNAYRVLGEVGRAIAYYEQALTIAREIGDRRGEGNHLGNLGNAYSDLGEVGRAIAYYEQALAIAREIGDLRGESNRLGNLGNAYRDLGEVGQAIGYYEQALTIAREIGDRRGEGNRLGNLGNAYSALGEVGQAIGYYEQALTIAREIGDRRGEGAALGNLGNAYSDLGEVRRAIEYTEQALTIAHEIGDRRGEGADLGNLGNAYSALGEVERAIEYTEQALTVAREIGDRRGEGNHLGNLGLAYRDLGEVGQAIAYYEQALTIAREIGDRRGEGNRLGNLGNAYSALGEVGRAIGYYEQALTIAREIGDRRGEGAALGNLGNAYSDLGEVRRAIEYTEQALTIAREIGDRRGEGADLGNLGLAYSALGEVGRAIGYYEQALAIAREIGDRRMEGNTLGNLGLAYRDLGEVGQAIAYYEQALTIAREIGDWRGEGAALGNLGNAYRDLGEVGQAIAYYEQARTIAREIGDRRGEGVCCWDLGLLCEESDPARAAELMQVCVDYEREVGHPDAEADAERVRRVRERLGGRRGDKGTGEEGVGGRGTGMNDQ
jgi:tetratricopeptide (TPR) repeat protein